MRQPYIFVIQGDISRLQADALVFSTSTTRRGAGRLMDAFKSHVPGFEAALSAVEITEHGQTAWLELPASEHRPRGVVVVATIDREKANAASVERATRSAIEHALRQLEALGLDRKRIAMPSLGTGEGSAREQARSLARVQMRVAAETIADRGDVELIIVAYDALAYQRFIEARARLRTEHPWLEPPRLRDPSTRHLATAIRARECVLFVGSGLSIGAGLPSWDELISGFLDDFPEFRQALLSRSLERLPDHLPEKVRELVERELARGMKLKFDDYLDVAEWYHLAALAQNRDESHVHRVNALYGPSQTEHILPTVSHYLLMQLPFRIIITTNYDDLIERTLRCLRRGWLRVVTDEDVPQTGRQGTVSVVKFHGHATAETRAPERNAIVLTREEYDTFFERYRAKGLLLEGLLLNHHFFFVGYSRTDSDFQHIYGRVADMLDAARRRAFATSLEREDTRTLREQRREHLELFTWDEEHGHDRLSAMLRWLDGLAELAAGTPVTFLLENDPEEHPHLTSVYGSLQNLGEQLEGLEKSPLLTGEVEVCERILDALMDLGWEPRTVSLSRLWENLADRTDALEARRRLLTKAWSAAHRGRVDRVLEERLRHLDAGEDARSGVDGEPTRVGLAGLIARLDPHVHAEILRANGRLEANRDPELLESHLIIKLDKASSRLKDHLQQQAGIEARSGDRHWVLSVPRKQIPELSLKGWEPQAPPTNDGDLPPGAVPG